MSADRAEEESRAFPFSRQEARGIHTMLDWLGGSDRPRTIPAPPPPRDRDTGGLDLGRAVAWVANPPRGEVIRRNGVSAQLGAPRRHGREADPVRDLIGHQYFDPEPEPPRRPAADPGAAPYRLGDLAQALGLDIHTLRRWEARGLLPKADHRTAGTEVGGGIRRHGGKATISQRRYTPGQFNGLVRIATEERVADKSVTGQPRVPISRTEFATRARQLFERLAEAEAGEHVPG